MAYDATLLASIDQAIADLVAGNTIVQFTMNGYTVIYGQSDLQRLQDLRDRVSAEIEKASNPSPNFVRISTSKGT